MLSHGDSSVIVIRDRQQAALTPISGACEVGASRLDLLCSDLKMDLLSCFANDGAMCIVDQDGIHVAQQWRTVEGRDRAGGKKI